MKNMIFPFIGLGIMLLLVSCGDNNNIFSRFHKEGSSASIPVLLNDAESALEDNDPSKAKEIADKILAKEPDNSEALYIASAAGLKAAGFDLGGILTTVIGDSQQAADSLLDSFGNMDINSVAAAISEAVTNLGKISSGLGDGVIPADDIDVNLNLGILEILDAAVNIIDFDGDGTVTGDTDDVIQIDENYNVSIVIDGNTKSVSDLTEDDISSLNLITDPDGKTVADKVQESVAQIESAVGHISTAAGSAGLAGNDTVGDLTDSLNSSLKPELESFLSKLSI